MFARIAACVDGSPTGTHASQVAVEMAARFRCALTLVTVLPSGAGGKNADLERLVPMDARSQPLQTYLEELRRSAEGGGIPRVDLVYLTGPVVESLLRYLDEAPPDLVVVGTRGLSRGRRVLLGSVSSRLVSDAPCPVLVVRHVQRAGRRPKG